MFSQVKVNMQNIVENFINIVIIYIFSFIISMRRKYLLIIYMINLKGRNCEYTRISLNISLILYILLLVKNG